MKHSELTEAFRAAFGDVRGPALQRDLALGRFGARTALEAACDGEDPAAIWFAVCDEMELAEDWRYPHRRGPKAKPGR